MEPLARGLWRRCGAAALSRLARGSDRVARCDAKVGRVDWQGAANLGGDGVSVSRGWAWGAG